MREFLTCTRILFVCCLAVRAQPADFSSPLFAGNILYFFFSADDRHHRLAPNEPSLQSTLAIFFFPLVFLIVSSNVSRTCKKLFFFSSKSTNVESWIFNYKSNRAQCFKISFLFELASLSTWKRFQVTVNWIY